MEIELIDFVFITVILLFVIVALVVVATCQKNDLKTLKKSFNESIKTQHILVLFSSGQLHNALFALKGFEGAFNPSIKEEIKRVFLNLVVYEIKENKRFSEAYKDLPFSLIAIFYKEVPKNLKLEDLSKLIVGACINEVVSPAALSDSWDPKFFRETMRHFLIDADKFEGSSTIPEKRNHLQEALFCDFEKSSNADLNNDRRGIVKGRLIEFSYEVFPD